MSFAAPTRERNAPVLPLSAMVDILFLLLIFFMTASVFREQEHSIEISPPEAEHSRPADAQSAAVVTITEDDQLFLGDLSVSFDELRNRLAALVEQNRAAGRTTSLVVRGDRQSSHGQNIRVTDMAVDVGVERLSTAVIGLDGG